MRTDDKKFTKVKRKSSPTPFVLVLLIEGFELFLGMRRQTKKGRQTAGHTRTHTHARAHNLVGRKCVLVLDHHQAKKSLDLSSTFFFQMEKKQE